LERSLPYTDHLGSLRLTGRALVSDRWKDVLSTLIASVLARAGIRSALLPNENSRDLGIPFRPGSRHTPSGPLGMKGSWKYSHGAVPLAPWLLVVAGTQLPT